MCEKATKVKKIDIFCARLSQKQIFYGFARQREKIVKFHAIRTLKRPLLSGFMRKKFGVLKLQSLPAPTCVRA